MLNTTVRVYSRKISTAIRKNQHGYIRSIHTLLHLWVWPHGSSRRRARIPGAAYYPSFRNSRIKLLFFLLSSATKLMSVLLTIPAAHNHYINNYCSRTRYMLNYLPDKLKQSCWNIKMRFCQIVSDSNSTVICLSAKITNTETATQCFQSRRKLHTRALKASAEFFYQSLLRCSSNIIFLYIIEYWIILLRMTTERMISQVWMACCMKSFWWQKGFQLAILTL